LFKITITFVNILRTLALVVLLINIKNKNIYRVMFCTILNFCQLYIFLLQAPLGVCGMIAGLFFEPRQRSFLLWDLFLVKWVQHGKGHYGLRAHSLRLSFAQLSLDWNFFKCKNSVFQRKYDAGRDVICMSEKLEFQENPFALTTRFMIMFSSVLVWRWNRKVNSGTVEMFECKNNTSDWKCGSGDILFGN